MGQPDKETFVVNDDNDYDEGDDDDDDDDTKERWWRWGGDELPRWQMVIESITRIKCTIVRRSGDFSNPVPHQTTFTRLAG